MGNLLVNKDITGCLIGKGRKIKDELQEECGCDLFIDKEVFEGSSEKRVTMKGEGENVFKMMCKVSDKLIERLNNQKWGMPEGYGSNLWQPSIPQEFLEEKQDEEQEEAVSF